jgi:hypothetical protein
MTAPPYHMPIQKTDDSRISYGLPETPAKSGFSTVYFRRVFGMGRLPEPHGGQLFYSAGAFAMGGAGIS